MKKKLKEQNQQNIVDFLKYKENREKEQEEESDTSHQLEQQKQIKKELCMIHPVFYSDVKEVADKLQQNSVVIVDIQNTASALKEKIMDFIFGVCYALDGTIDMLDNNTYIISIAKTQVTYYDLVVK